MHTEAVDVGGFFLIARSLGSCAERGEVESTEKETLALLLQLQDPRDLANYYYKSEGCPRRQKKSKKTTVERLLGKERQKGSQDL